MNIEIRVAGVLRYSGSSTTRTSTILPSAGAITNWSPRGPVRVGSRKKTSSQTASRNRTASGIHTQDDPRATQAPSTTSAQPGRMNGKPSGASLTTPPHTNCGLAIADCGLEARTSNPQSAIRNPQSVSSDLQLLPGDPSIRLQVPLARRLHDFARKRRRGGVAVPLALLLQSSEVVPQRLLVEARLAAAGSVAVRGPEARRVGRQDLVDHEQATVGRGAELELRIGDDDASRRRVAAARLVQAEARAPELVGEGTAERFDDVSEGHVLVVAHVGFGRRRED